MTWSFRSSQVHSLCMEAVTTKYFGSNIHGHIATCICQTYILAAEISRLDVKLFDVTYDMADPDTCKIYWSASTAQV